MREFNPNHPVTQKAHDNWHKIVALLIHKYELGEVVITQRDFEKFTKEHPDPVVLLHDKKDGLHLKILTLEEGEHLAREHGGMRS